MALDDLKGLMIAVLLCVVVISGGVSIIGYFSESNPTIDTNNEIGQFSNAVNRADNITNSVDQAENSISGISGSGGGGALGWINVLFGSMFNGLKAIFGTLGFVGVAMQEAALFFGIPVAIIQLLSLIITVLIIFAIWSAVTRQA